MAAKLGLAALLGPAGRQRDLALALVISRVVASLRTGSARRQGRRRSRRPGSTASPTPRRTPRSKSRRPGHIHGSRRTFPSGDSSMTSAPDGSARCSPTGRQSLVSQGVAAPACAAGERLGAELALKLHKTPDLPVRAGRARPWWAHRGRDRDPGDFFHSRLAASPDGSFLLSTGWVWHPQAPADLLPLSPSSSGSGLGLGVLDAEGVGDALIGGVSLAVDALGKVSPFRRIVTSRVGPGLRLGWWHGAELHDGVVPEPGVVGDPVQRRVRSRRPEERPAREVAVLRGERAALAANG
jgi:hypothetical protein